MTHETLLRELETLPHGARLRRMAELGRQSLTDATISPVLATLAQAEDVFGRTLALASCWGSGDATLAEGARTDPSRTVRTLALVVLAHFGSAASVVRAVAELPHRKARRHFIQTLARARRTEVLDAVLEALQAEGDPDVVRFVAYGSTARVEAWLTTEGEKLGWVEVGALARRHPQALTKALLVRVQALSGRDPQLLELCRRALPFLSQEQAELALELVAALRVRYTLAELALPDTLLRRRPEAVADLILATDEPVWVSVVAAAKALDTERLVALAHQHPNIAFLHNAWPELSPEQRRALWEVCGTGWRLANGALPLAIAQKLPDAAVRYAEARRCGALPALATRPQERLPYAGLLPWDEARIAVEPYLKNPDADLRALALGALCRVAGYHADALPALLALLKAREFEQDPVRQAMLTGLVAIPPGRWQAEHLEDLTTILTYARNAADLSYASGAQAVALVGSLLKRFPEWAAPELAVWVKTRGQLDLSSLQHGLSDADVARLEPHLMPVLRSWKTRERESHLLNAATLLDKRLPALPGLVALLEQVVQDTAHNGIAARALSLLKEHQRERFVALVPELLAKDPSWITQPVVWSHLHRQRQDLLTDDFLGRRPFSGRFSTGRTRFVLPVCDAFYRWTPRQQQLFAQSLAELLTDSERPNYESFQALKQYAELLDVTWRPVLNLARQEARNPALRDTALRALARLDGGQGLETLVEALTDDRMRIAIYALRASVLELPLPRALAVLREAPRRRITVAKEVLRLLGDLPQGAGLDELLSFDQEPELHRDLRVALVRALWPHREREVVWPILERALHSGDAPLAAITLRAPLDGLSATALRRQLGLIAQGIGHADPSIRLSALEAALTVPNTEGILTEPVLMCLSAPLPDERAAANQVLVQTLCADTPSLAETAVRRVLANRRALVGVLEALLQAVAQGRGRWESASRAALEALSVDPLTITLQTRLALASLPEEALLAWLQTTPLADDALAAGIASLEQRAQQQLLPALESALRGGSPVLRRLGLAVLVGHTRGTQGWTDEARATLAMLCADSNPLVAAAAQLTFPPETA